MIKKSTKKDNHSMPDSPSCSECKTNSGNCESIDLSDLKKIISDSDGGAIPLHTIHGDVTYHFVTNIYLCPSAADKIES